MKLGKKVRYVAAAFLMLLSTVTPMGGALLRSAYAETNNAPANSKSIKSNGDGTYTIALSVTGATESSTTTEATKANVILVLDTSTSMINNNTTYNGTRMTRLDAEKHVLTDNNGIIDSMLSQNVAGDPVKSDIIEIAVANFGTRGSTAQSFTTNATALKNTINGLSATQGTNWEEGLMRAQELAASIKTSQPNEEVYVILLTDGEPTTHYNDYTVNINYAQEWGQANDNARALVTAGHHFYGIFTWGSGNSSHYLSSLVQYAYTGSGNSNTALVPAYAEYFSDATETSDLIDALTQIVNDITTGVGYTNVEMTDGVTTMTASSVKATAGGEVTGLKYYRSGGSYGTANPNNGNYGTEWTEAPRATINDKGEVDWDLGSQVLENGVTYTMTFAVWPKQESLDLVADLNNGIKSYGDLTPEQQAQIAVSSGVYTLKTNTDYPTVTYSTVTTTTQGDETSTVVSDPVTINIANPDPVDLTGSSLNAVKLWEDSLDESQREEIDDVTLYLKVDGDYYYKDDNGNGLGVTLTRESNWTESNYINVAPGLMVTSDSPAYDPNAPHVTWNGKTYAILEEGHEYVFEEDKSSQNVHFELTAYTHHPMIMGMNADGSLIINDVIFTKDESGNITGIESVSALGDNISATNTLKGGINISKKVVDETGATVDTKDKFKAKVYLVNEDGSAYKYDYRIYYGENNPCYKEKCGDVSDEDFSKHRSGHIKGTSPFEQELYVGDTIRVVNVDSGVGYYVEEPVANIPFGYDKENVNISYDFTSSTEGKTAKTMTIGGKTYYVMQGNSVWDSVITNKYAFGHLKVSKTVNGATTKYPRSFDFTLNLYYKEGDETKELTDWAYDYTIGETAGTLHYGETFSLANGEEILIKNLPESVTYKVTEAAADGYNTTAKTGDEGTIVKNETASAAFTNTYSLSGHVRIEAKKQFNNWPYGDTFTFNLTGEGKNLTDTIENANDSAVFEFDVNEEKTYVYTISETGTLRDGVTKTSGDITVVVTAVEQKDDNGYGTGVLAIETQYTSAGGNVITNTYEAKGTVQFSATKLLTGRDWANQESFAFTLYGSDATYSLGDVIGSKTATETSAAVFDEIEYSFGNNQADKTFYYVIRETTSLDGTGMTNNTGDLHVKVDVTDKHDGTLETKVTYENGQVIENVYSAEGKATLKATKTMSGRSWNEGETYTFELKDETGATIATKTVSANGEITFTDDDFVSADKVLNFDQDDVLDGPITKKYTITETGNMSANGLTPSADIQVEVTVSDAGNGVLRVETNYVDGNTITNTYAASGSVTLEATKKFAGADRDWTENYTFNLSGNGQNQDKVATKAKPTVTFDAIPYTLDDAGKTYTYTIAETGMNLAGVTASGVITVDVTVTDDGHGNLTATPVYANGVKEITNTYYTEPVDVTLHVDKLIVDDSGESGVDGTFEFTLSGNGVSETQTVTTENLKGGVDFTTMQFTKAGTYTYTLKEVDSGEDGFTYDTTEYTVTITVSDTAEAKLVAQVAYGESDKLEITNHYATSTAITFTATKKLNGWDENNGYDAPTFYFALYEVAEDGTETQVGENKSVSGSGTVNFDAISYTKTGTYNYVVKEVSGNAGGISYDDAEYKIVVVVTGENGALKATPTITKDGESASSITFENNYLAKGTITLQAEKVLNGRDWLEGEKHTFVLKSGNTVLQTKDVTSKGVISFDEIEYTKAGTYTYTVEEELSDDYDGSLTHTGAVTVTVNVKDNGDGTLTASCSTEDVPTITNTYTSEGSVDIDVTKVVTGREWLAGETFTFALYKDGEKVAEKTVTKDEPTATFTMDYTQKDTDGAADENGEVKLEYTIKEISEMPANMEQPDDLSVVVTLKDDNYGNIEATVDQPDGYTITNEYVPTPTSAQFHVEKEIDDRSDSGANGEFTFVLKDENGEEIESKTINTENKSGADFTAITYTKAGTYKYTITEQGGSAAGYSYDEVAHNVVVTVTDDNAGTLTATVTYDGNESLTITNVYEAEPVDVTIDVEKSIYGIDNVDSDKLPTFEFELTGDGVDDTMKVTITGEGKASFGAVTFTKVGTYTLKVHEIEGNAGGYIYDDNDVTVTVVVTDNGGQLVAEVSYSKGLAEGLETAIFTNGYEAAPIEDYEIIVQKMLEGRDLVEGEFQFVLIDTNGEEIATGTNDANGNVVFSGISFDEVGTYNFLVKEVADPERGEIDFDTNEYEVTIVVKDNGEGQLVVESDTSSEVIFKNKYNEPGKGENPRTDDDILSVVAMMVISTIGLIGAVLFGKRAKQEDKVEA